MRFSRLLNQLQHLTNIYLQVTKVNLVAVPGVVQAVVRVVVPGIVTVATVTAVLVVAMIVVPAVVPGIVTAVTITAVRAVAMIAVRAVMTLAVVTVVAVVVAMIGKHSPQSFYKAHIQSTLKRTKPLPSLRQSDFVYKRR